MLPLALRVGRGVKSSLTATGSSGGEDEGEGVIEPGIFVDSVRSSCFDANSKARSRRGFQEESGRARMAPKAAILSRLIAGLSIISRASHARGKRLRRFAGFLGLSALLYVR